MLEDSNPGAEISILNDNMAAQAPIFCGNSESESVFLWVIQLKKLQSLDGPSNSGCCQNDIEGTRW